MRNCDTENKSVYIFGGNLGIVKIDFKIILTDMGEFQNGLNYFKIKITTL